MLLWNPQPIPVFDPGTGYKAGGAKAYFYVGGTSTPLLVYTSDDGAAPHAWPVEADANGVFPFVFVPYGTFGFRVTTAGGTSISPNVLTVQNPAPPDSGGGGGIIVQADQILQTGDTMWRLDSDVRSGWVFMNGGTIGNVGSGATLRANADTEALYLYLYNKVSNTYAPVSGGRTTASADFAANKPIVVPTMAGFIKGGLDTMGANASNRIQVSTTISTTNANTSATVNDATGLSIGMKIVSANVPAGTTITAISGTTITLSGNASGTASGTAARFSFFDDAQVVGAIGGVSGQAVNEKELPIITPAGTLNITVDAPALRTNNGASINATMGGLAFTNSGSNSTSLITTQPVNVSVKDFVGTQFGGGLALSRIQPTRLGTDYIKL